MKTRLIISLLVVNAIVLVACGTGSENVAGPRRIVLGNFAGAMADSRGVEGGVSDTPAGVGSVTYVATDAVLDEFDGADPGATHPSWEFVAPGNPAGDLQSVVDALNLGPGAKIERQQDVPGGYGTNITDGPVFSSYGNEKSRWWYYSVFGLGAKDGSVSSPCMPDAKGCGDVPSTLPPARNLPGAADARERAISLLERMGVDAESLVFTGSSDAWGAYVNATHMLDGVATPMAWNFTFGDNGELTNAAGPVFTARRGDEYPVITTREAVARLNSTDTNGLFSAPSSRRLSPQDPGGDGDDVTVTLTSVTLSMAAYWSGGGTALMLPAYVFGTEDEGTVEVLAVPDRFLAPPEVTATPIPEPTVGTPTVESARTLVGLSESEAGKVAETAGWVLRVVRRDGEDFMVTQEFNGSRVNIEVTRGTVSEVLSVG
jgi:hypothetical protein